LLRFFGLSPKNLEKSLTEVSIKSGTEFIDEFKRTLPFLLIIFMLVCIKLMKGTLGIIIMSI
jgi:hypothetical protein